MATLHKGCNGVIPHQIFKSSTFYAAKQPGCLAKRLAFFNLCQILDISGGAVWNLGKGRIGDSDRNSPAPQFWRRITRGCGLAGAGGRTRAGGRGMGQVLPQPSRWRI